MALHMRYTSMVRYGMQHSGIVLLLSLHPLTMLTGVNNTSTTVTSSRRQTVERMLWTKMSCRCGS